jgi:hypothetical protein
MTEITYLLKDALRDEGGTILKPLLLSPPWALDEKQL